jgi:hypothetical protein
MRPFGWRNASAIKYVDVWFLLSLNQNNIFVELLSYLVFSQTQAGGVCLSSRIDKELVYKMQYKKVYPSKKISQPQGPYPQKSIF